MATACSGVASDNVSWLPEGLVLHTSNQGYYNFEGSTDFPWPKHDPCGLGTTNHKKGVTSPGGQIYLR